MTFLLHEECGQVTLTRSSSRPFWKVRALSLVMTVVAAVLSLVAALVAVATPALAERLGGPFATALELLRFPVAGLLMMFLWSLLYWKLPDVEQRFRFITPGAVVGVVIWLAASWGFSLYVNHFGKYDATYGALGGVIVLILWMWISAQVIVLGAEINSIIEQKSPDGKRPGEKQVPDEDYPPAYH